MYRVIRLFTHKENLYMNGVTRSYGRAYTRGGGGAYTWSSTSVKEKVSLSAGGLIGGEYGSSRVLSIFFLSWALLFAFA